MLYEEEHSPRSPYVQTRRDAASFITHSHSAARCFSDRAFGKSCTLRLQTDSQEGTQRSTLVLINSSCQEQVLICFYRTLMSLDYDSMEVGRFPAL